MRLIVLLTASLPFASPALLLAADPDLPALDPALSQAEIDDGFVSLFDGKSLDGWVGVDGNTDNYFAQDGVLIAKAYTTSRGHIFTKSEFADFILRLDIKLEPGGNNGVGIRTRISKEPHLEGMEIQVLDDAAPKHANIKAYQHHGSIYGVVPAEPGHLKPAGQWNREEILCKGRHVKVTLNGAVIVDANLDDYVGKTAMDGKEHPGLEYEKGRIGLHAHGSGQRVYFRNIRIKEL